MIEEKSDTIIMDTNTLTLNSKFNFFLTNNKPYVILGSKYISIIPNTENSNNNLSLKQHELLKSREDMEYHHFMKSSQQTIDH